MASRSLWGTCRACHPTKVLPNLASSSKSASRPISNSFGIHPRTPLNRLTRRYYAETPFPTARKQSPFRPISVLVMLVPFVTFGLGIWQVKRLGWKLDLIDDIQRNIEKEPLILPPNVK